MTWRGGVITYLDFIYFPHFSSEFSVDATNSLLASVVKKVANSDFIALFSTPIENREQKLPLVLVIDHHRVPIVHVRGCATRSYVIRKFNFASK